MVAKIMVSISCALSVLAQVVLFIDQHENTTQRNETTTQSNESVQNEKEEMPQSGVCSLRLYEHI